MSTLVAVPVVAGLVGAGLAVLLEPRRRAQRTVTFTTLTVQLAVSVALLVMVESDGILTAEIGGWSAPLGIVLVADRLAVIMLVVGSVISLSVAVYGVGTDPPMDDAPFLHPVYLVMTSGISLAFLSGDLFNLFVSFEVLLVASYVLLTLGASRDQIRSGITYVVINAVGSLLFVTTVAFVYAATGTVNLADLATQMGELSPGVRSGLHLLLVVVFGLKAAVFPLSFWLPDSYPIAAAPITAVFAGLLTKVGVYALIRTETLLFPGETSVLLLVIAAVTMVVGVLGALAQHDIKRILSFHIVSQIGYMVFGLALLTVAGVAGAIFYVVHHIIVKTSLFLTGGLVEQRLHTSALRKLSGVLHSTPVLAVLFVVPALSLAGMPPFSGFVAKLLLVQAGIDAGTATVVAVSLFVSLLTLFSMAKIWAGGFWGEASPTPGRVTPVAASATAVLVGVTVAVAVAAAPLLALTTRAAEDLLDRQPYIEAVLP